jgi:hypothetical protein
LNDLPETLPEAPTPPLAIPAAKAENLASFFFGNKRDLKGRGENKMTISSKIKMHFPEAIVSHETA